MTTDPFRHHGGRIWDAAQCFPHAPAPWLDLSTGISPWSYPFDPVEPQIWQCLPDQQALSDLEAVAGKSFGGVCAEQIVAVPGLDIAIRLLATLLPAGHVNIIGPTYGGYQSAWPGAKTVAAECARAVDITICARPNNPDGGIISKTILAHFPGTVIVDEAFADAAPDHSLLPHQKDIVVLRSFGKFYGLAGVRLGFVIADTSLIARLRSALGDWPVSGPAIVIGTQAYSDVEWQTKQRRRLVDAASQLKTLLQAHDLTIVGGTPLFQLISHKAAQTLFNHLCTAGILVRPFAGEPEWLRFGIPGTLTDVNRLTLALNNWTRP